MRIINIYDGKVWQGNHLYWSIEEVLALDIVYNPLFSFAT